MVFGAENDMRKLTDDSAHSFLSPLRGLGILAQLYTHGSRRGLLSWPPPGAAFSHALASINKKRDRSIPTERRRIVGWCVQVLLLAGACIVSFATNSNAADEGLYFAKYPDTDKYAMALRIDKDGKSTDFGIIEMVGDKNGEWVPQTIFQKKDKSFSIIWDIEINEMIGLCNTNVSVRIGTEIEVGFVEAKTTSYVKLKKLNDMEIKGDSPHVKTVEDNRK